MNSTYMKIHNKVGYTVSSVNKKLSKMKIIDTNVKKYYEFAESIGFKTPNSSNITNFDKLNLVKLETLVDKIVCKETGYSNLTQDIFIIRG